jgi:hypothetical protein
VDNLTPQGTVAGTGNFVPSAGNDPGFFNLAGNDFHLTAGSAAVNAGEALTTGWSGITDVSPFLLEQQANRGTIDLGAYYYVSPVTPTSVSVSPLIVTGGQSAMGTVTLNQAALTGGASVALSSDDPAVTVPSSALVAEGQTSANFPVTTSAVAANKTVTLTGLYNAVSKTASLIVTKATPTASVIIDDGDAGHSTAGSWSVYGAGYQSDIHYAAAGSGSVTSTWHFTGLTPGRYRIAATWPYSSTYANNAPFSVSWPISTGQTLTDLIAVNQATTPGLVGGDFTADGAGWRPLGTYDVYATSLDVQLTNAANKTVIADAVRVDRVGDLAATNQTATSKIIDNGEAGFSTVGAWTFYGAGYLSDLHYAAPGDGSATSTWHFSGVKPGRYRVAVNWPYSSTYANNAPFTVTWPTANGQALTDPFALNEATTPNDFIADGSGWKTLGTNYMVYNSSLDVQLTNAANKFVIADAARLDRVGDIGNGVQMEASVEGAPTAAGAPGGTLAFGNAFAGAPLQKRIWVKSVGTSVVQLSAPITLPAGYSLVSGFGQTTLPPGGQTSFTVQLDAMAAGAFNGTVSFGANDPDFDGTFSFTLQGSVTATQIIDDGDAGHSTVGSWTLYGAGYQSDLRYAAAGSGSLTSTWHFSGLTPGRYRVAATWPYSSAYATNAPFTVMWPVSASQTVSAPLSINQATTPGLIAGDFTADGTGWRPLGTFEVSGSTLDVKLTNAANKTVIADAVRVDRLGDLPPGGQTVTSKILDDGAAGYSTAGSWTLYGAGYQSDLHYAPSGDGSSTSTWTFTNLVPGRYRVAATWPFSSAYATNAPFSVQWPNIVGQAMNDPQPESQATTPNDFAADGAGWKTLGATYDVYGSTLTVQLSNAANKTVISDAVRVDRVGDLP